MRGSQKGRIKNGAPRNMGGMSDPRARRRGSFLFICRRTEGRAFRMARPEVMAAFAVLLADAARRTGVRLVAVAVLPNHYHAVVWDVDGRLPEFLRDLHAQVARFANALDEVQLRFWKWLF